MIRPDTFYLGTDLPGWLNKTDVPLFLSARWLRKRKSLPRAIGPWSLDSGGFTELSLHGRWTVSATQYSSEARHWYDRIGGMRWCAPQDWMCEPLLIKGGITEDGRTIPGTDLSVPIHQRLTVDNYLLLRQLSPDLPWIPVLQGWQLDDYLRCIDLYAARGVDLASLPLVGLGSVCRRQNTQDAEQIVRAIVERSKLPLHAFGFKIHGLKACRDVLASADSFAWSYDARRRGKRLPECTHKGKTCNKCLRYALRWREKVCRLLAKPAQLRMW